jgi:Ser/Thr protein kinase RdoA (MazF antagonist)
VNSRRSAVNPAAEMAWLAALSADTDINVPTPQPNTDGALVTHIWSDDLRRDTPCALFSWLPGPDLDNDEKSTPVRLRTVGRATAALHRHADRWVMPSDAELPTIDTPLMDSPNRLTADHELLTPERRVILDAAFSEVEGRYLELFDGARSRPLHADLHLGNLKWNRGRLYVFDFDDSGMGLPMQDLAIAAYYLRPAAHLEDALLAGYAEVAPLPTYSPAQYEAVVASRNLVLLNDIVDTANADFRELLPTYVPNTIAKLRHYLDTGVYRHDIDGLLVRGR